MVKGKKVVVPRRKIEIKCIKNEDARQSCFSKRRQGLFKKASELSILCGATVGAVVFSKSGNRSFSFGHPSINHVADRFTNLVASGSIATGGASHDNSRAVTDTAHRLNMEYLELQQALDSENKKKESLQEALQKEKGEPTMQWLNANVMELDVVEMEEFQKCLGIVDGAVKEKMNQVLVDARKMTQVSVPQLHMEIASTSQHQFGQHFSANSMAFAGPSSSSGFIDGFEVNDPLRNGGLEDICGLGNFPNNQNHG